MAKYNQLTDTAIRKAKPANKVQKLSDGGGLRLEVTKAGAKVFKFRFKLDGKDSDFVIGQYPHINLSEARRLKEDARQLVKQGINPNNHKKAEKQKRKAEELARQSRYSFREVFESWHKHSEDGWTYGYGKAIRERVEAHLIPPLGDIPADDIKPKDMLKALKEIEAKGIMETLSRSKQYASRIFRYGVGMGYCERDPTRDLPNDVFKKQEKKNLNHLTDRKDLYQLLNAVVVK